MGSRHIEAAQVAGLKIVGLVDAKREALDAVASANQLMHIHLTQELSSALALKPDVVVAAITTLGRAAVVQESIAAGVKYILCEKPMAASLAECDSMVAACKASGTKIAINHQMRYMEIFRKPAELAASETFGGISSMHVTAGNFGLAMNGTHYFETFRWVTGESPVTARACFDSERIPNPRGPSFYDNSGWILLTTSSGKRFYLDAGANQGHGVQSTYACKRGMITVNDLTGELRFSCRNWESSNLPSTRYGMPGPSGVIQLPPADATTPTRHVLEALLAEHDYPTLTEARLAVACMVAATVSSENGGIEVPINHDLPVDRSFPWA